MKVALIVPEYTANIIRNVAEENLSLLYQKIIAPIENI